MQNMTINFLFPWTDLMNSVTGNNEVNVHVVKENHLLKYFILLYNCTRMFINITTLRNTMVHIALFDNWALLVIAQKCLISINKLLYLQTISSTNLHRFKPWVFNVTCQHADMQTYINATHLWFTAEYPSECGAERSETHAVIALLVKML